VNVLVVAPHPDDETLGCGGTLALHVQAGERVGVVFLTSGELGLKAMPTEEAWRIREAEAEGAAQLLGLADLAFLRQPDWFLGDNVETAALALRPVLKAWEPQTVYVPHALEWHPDHRATLPVLRRALLGLDLAPQVWAYEVWTPLPEYDDVRDIGGTMDLKLAALRCYASQLAQLRYDRAIEGLNRYRGEMAARCDYAEVFSSVGQVENQG
jgi:N-acetylglucosamine malate deacetylase 1